MILLSILLATISISAIAFCAALILSSFPRFLNKALPGLVALGAGTLLAACILHLLPEAQEQLGGRTASVVLLISFVSFLIGERLLKWHHCHEPDCEKKSIGTLNLISDAVHNFMDGVIIATAFVINPALGISTTIAIAIHELPQEIADFAVLIHSGYTRKQALWANAGIALTAVLGGIFGYTMIQSVSSITPYMTAVAAGTLLYIATIDLIPEIQHEENRKTAALHLGLFVIGILIIAAFQVIVPEHGHDSAHEEIHHSEHRDESSHDAENHNEPHE